MSTLLSPDVAISDEVAFEAPSETQGEKGSYGQILKSSALIGGTQVLNIAIGIVRTKVLAIWLGPGGFGLASLYQSINDVTQNVAEMGVNSSGVRQIAEAVGSRDTNRIALTTAVLRRTSIILGLLGACFLVLFSRQVSTLTFGTGERAAAVGLLGISVLFRITSAGQAALLQGLRRISDLAKTQALGALFGLFISIPLVYFLREQGLALYLVGVAATMVATSWCYSRRVKIKVPPVSLAQVGCEVAGLLKLGFAFMLSGMMTVGVAYVVRITLLHKLGLQATGLYQCAWTFGGLYVGFILQAMAADFYPRLTGSINDHKTCNRLVNEQARVGLLLAGPGVIATLAFAPAVIELLYSSRFAASVPILRWICLGATLQVITWPMGFIIVAKAKQKFFVLSEVAWALVSVGLAWACIARFGVSGAGIAFFGSYVFHGFMTYAIVRRITGFRWSKENINTGMLFLPIIAAVFCAFYVLPGVLAGCLGILGTVATGVFSGRCLLKLVSLNEVPRPVRNLVAMLNSLRWAAN